MNQLGLNIMAACCVIVFGLGILAIVRVGDTRKGRK